MTTAGLVIETSNQDGVRWLWLNRPQLGNAFDDHVIRELTRALAAAAEDNTVRCIVLAGRGKHFSAGADFNWMQRMVELPLAENTADAMQLASLMRAINECPKPTIAAVNGAAFGGALGLICACDIAVAADNATFCLSEVKLGLIPAVISPYVVAAMGRRQASRWMLTAAPFNAATARDIDVVHEVVPADDLHTRVQAIAVALNQNGPQALGECKRLIRDVSSRPLDNELVALTANRIAHIRVGAEGQEGLRAFLQKREPAWRKKD